jgi:hypothetical protein
MRLLLDTDVFCKLAICGLIEDTIHILGATLSECGRLPALPYMLKRGRLHNKYGAETCIMLQQIVESIPPIRQPGDEWLEKLAQIEAVDPGEAQLFAVAAQHGLMVITGDKRALLALKAVDGLPSALNGRVVVLEAALIALCNDLGPAKVGQCLQPLSETDLVIKICFSNSRSDPRECLRSYYNKLVTETAPLVLWKP